MNTDAVTVARYFYRMSAEQVAAVDEAYMDSTTRPLAQYVNEIPLDVHRAMKRILEIE